MRYQKTLAELSRAEAAVERWTVRVLRAAARLEEERRAVKRLRKRLEKKEAGSTEICGWCGYINAQCQCPQIPWRRDFEGRFVAGPDAGKLDPSFVTDKCVTCLRVDCNCHG